MVQAWSVSTFGCGQDQCVNQRSVERHHGRAHLCPLHNHMYIELAKHSSSRTGWLGFDNTMMQQSGALYGKNWIARMRTLGKDADDALFSA